MTRQQPLAADPALNFVGRSRYVPAMVTFRGSARDPAFWLAVGLPWPDDAEGGIAECVFLSAPNVIDLTKLSEVTQIVYYAAEHYAAQSGHRVVMLGDLPAWLTNDDRAQFEAALEELRTAPIPGLFFAMDMTSWTALCVGPSVSESYIHYGDGTATQITADLLAEVRRNLTSAVVPAWGPYIEPFLSREAAARTSQIAQQPAPELPPAGWYPDPSGSHSWRWWNGTGWT